MSVQWPKCECGGVAVDNASGDITRTCIRCGGIVKPQAQTPIENNDIRHEAAGNLAFLLSVVRCGEQLSEAEEANVRRVIRDLNLSQGALTPVGEQQLAAARAEAQELRAERDRWKSAYGDAYQERDQLCAFANDILRIQHQDGDIDGSDVQDCAVKHGLLTQVTATEPCCEGCDQSLEFRWGFCPKCGQPSPWSNAAARAEAAEYKQAFEGLKQTTEAYKQLKNTRIEELERERDQLRERLEKAERLTYNAWSLLVEIAESGIFEEALDACDAEIAECGPLLQYERYQRRKKIAEDAAAKYKALIDKTKAAIERREG